MFYPFFITFKEKPGLLNIPQKLEASFLRFKISPRAQRVNFIYHSRTAKYAKLIIFDSLCMQLRTVEKK